MSPSDAAAEVSQQADPVGCDDGLRRRFADGVRWLDLGEDLVGERLAGKLNGATYHLTRERPPLTDPKQAGTELGRALRDRRMLIVVDDVWHDSQVKAPTQGDTPSVWLLTTRDRSLAPRSAMVVEVGALGEASATALLTAGGAPDPRLRQCLDAYENEEPEIPDRERFERFIGTSVARLAAEDRARFVELAVLPADVTVDEQVVTVFWAWTGGLSEFRSRRLLTLLSDRCLIRNEARGVVRLHDVIHDYLRALPHERIRCA